VVNNISDRVVLVTLTYYDINDSDQSYRAELAKDMITTALSSGYEIIVVDGGSSKEFLDGINGAIVLQEKDKGMGLARRQGFRKAFSLKKEVIIWLEAEKNNFVPFIEGCAELILDGSADIVVPRRKVS